MGSWRVDGQFASDPVVDSGKTYVLNTASNQLEARDLATGALLWAWQPAGSSETFPLAI